MKERILWICLLGIGIGYSVTASAQQPPVDPTAAAYRQLLSEANDRVVGMAGQVQKLEQQVQILTKQLDEAKKHVAADAKPPETTPPKP